MKKLVTDNGYKFHRPIYKEIKMIKKRKESILFFEEELKNLFNLKGVTFSKNTQEVTLDKVDFNFSFKVNNYYAKFKITMDLIDNTKSKITIRSRVNKGKKKISSFDTFVLNGNNPLMKDRNLLYGGIKFVLSHISSDVKLELNKDEFENFLETSSKILSNIFDLNYLKIHEEV